MRQLQSDYLDRNPRNWWLFSLWRYWRRPEIQIQISCWENQKFTLKLYTINIRTQWKNQYPFRIQPPKISEDLLVSSNAQDTLTGQILLPCNQSWSLLGSSVFSTLRQESGFSHIQMMKLRNDKKLWWTSAA